MQTQDFQQEEQEEHIQLAHSPAAVVTLIVLGIAFLGATVFFGFQTWLFVNWLLPEDGLAMKVLAVINFDAFSYIWLAVGLFLARWIQALTRTLAVIAGIVTFILSMACSVVQMMIASAERFGAVPDPNYVYTADGFIIFALVWNICTLLAIIHIQWPYISGYHPPRKLKRGGWFGKKAQTPVPQAIDYDTLARKMLELQQQASPLASPPLDASQASQMGANGYKE